MIWWQFSRSLSRWPFNCVLTETVWISACHRIYHEIAVIMHLCKGKCIKECVKICEIKLLQNEQQIAKINPREILFLPNFVHVMFSTLKGIIYWTHRPLGGWSFTFAAVRPFVCYQLSWETNHRISLTFCIKLRLK